MSKIKYTPQGFSYVDVGLDDILRWGGYGICNYCNRGPMRKMKLIFILADTYCEDCFNEWVERAKNYNTEDIESDLKIQREQHIRWYSYHLGKGFEDGE